MRPYPTRTLVLAVVVVSIVVTVVTELRIAGFGSVLLSAFVAYAAFAANIVISALGFRTPERGWWIANVVLSILTATYLGAPTLPSALWTVGRVLAARVGA